MRSTALALLATIAVAFASADASACPACNIHNYLTASVHTSKNIFVGKIISAVGNEEAMVEIVSVLRGTATVGTRVQRKIWNAGEHIGERIAFCDPESGPPNFPCLTGVSEDEVVFLTGFGLCPGGMSVFDGPGGDVRLLKPTDPKPVIKDVAEAIRRVQGISNESRQMGLEYLLTFPVPQTRLIIEALEERRQQGGHAYEVECLVQALLLKPSARVEGYALHEVSRLVQIKRPAIGWNTIPEHPSEDGRYLTALVGYAGATWSGSTWASYHAPKREPLTNLIDRQRKRIIEALPNMDDLTLAETAFAVCETQTLTPTDLLSLLKDSRSKDGFALGMFLLAEERSACWDWKGAEVARKIARDAAERTELRNRIEQAIQEHAKRSAAK